MDAAHDWGELKAQTPGRPVYTYEVSPQETMHHMFGAGSMYSTDKPMTVKRTARITGGFRA
jgi:hypothetical protein